MMTALTRMPRLFVTAPLAADEAVALDDGQAHRLRTVLRLGAGAPVRVFNGIDGEWIARLARLERKGGEAVPERRLHRQPDDRGAGPWLVFAPLKRGPLELMVEKATELGAARLVPVLTRRTVPERVKTERLRARAVEAAEQCERLDVPTIEEPRPLDAVIKEWPADRRLLVLDERGGAAVAAARAFGEVAADRVAAAVLVGPEGGFTATELDALRNLAFAVAVGLGPRILRAETAALAALAGLQLMAGDGDRRPPGLGAADAPHERS